MPDSPSPAVPASQLLQFFDQMVLIREFDLQAVRSRRQGLIPGFIHASQGQEAIAVGACAARQDGDVITSTHRGHAHHLALGGSVDTTMAELAGRVTGTCGGCGGSLHVADKTLGNIGANGIVGAGIPIAVGAALSFAIREEPRVALSFFGDGATNQGTFHESLNMAALWNLPVVFVCENNHYAEGTAQGRHMAETDISLRAVPFGIASIDVDGNDVQAVFEAASTAFSRARVREGPTLIVANTNRLCGAYEGDPQLYRSKQDVVALEAVEPIVRLRATLIELGYADDTELKSRINDARERIRRAVEFAEGSDFPEPDAGLYLTYVDDLDGALLEVRDL
ncbi:MAG: pyruvate dehydrogenase (acetyl-transferring) E1 component subunit alpha [Chloroflexi bacterium]|nr:pyruvate dehydrogenase (acetyl-transferring) E1 component subunit alpha [Chloroflexota bacterium]